MNPHPPPGEPTRDTIENALRSVRLRGQALTVFAGVLWTAAGFCGVLLLAMLIDLAIGWLDTRARIVMTALALAVPLTAFALTCLRPLFRRRTLVGTALDIERTQPGIEERLSTATELAGSTDPVPLRGSASLIQQVTHEAAAASRRLEPQRLYPARRLAAAGWWFAGAFAAVALFFLLGASSARVLLLRFLMPTSAIALTRVTAAPANTWVPLGEPLTLTADLDGRIPRQPPQLFLRSDDGASRRLRMLPSPETNTSFLATLATVSTSFTYRVRAGDGQTDWHAIRAVDRPNITAVQVHIVPPAYSALPADDRDTLPPTLRILAGSELTLRFRADQPLDQMALDLGDETFLPLTAVEEQWYEYRGQPTNSFRFAALATSQHGLHNRQPPTSRVEVFEDLAPTVTILDPSTDTAVRPDEKIELTFEATDDFGVAQAELEIATVTAEGQTNLVSIPIDLGSDQDKKQVQRTVPIDPSSLGLKSGDQLSVAVRVTDTKNPMTGRPLDVGQAGTCNPRNLQVDEWAGDFDGERRHKLEIAIAPELEKLDRLLAEAQGKTAELREPAASATGLASQHAATLTGARDAVASAEALITALKSRTSGTPYAMIGLQLQDLGTTHLAAARRHLGNVSLEPDQNAGNPERLDRAAFHLTQAREWLARLNQTFETARRDQNLADAMQRLQKMYQIFLEDTQALLGRQPGPLNAYDRKVAEVDEEFVERLRELLEQKKAILAELAKALQEDPRLLRRYLAGLNQQATSYRDQLTLLHRRQAQLQSDLQTWNSPTASERSNLLSQIRLRQSERQKTIAQEANHFRENLETWLPLEVKPDTAPIPRLLASADKAARLAANDQGAEALDEWRELRGALPELSRLVSLNPQRLTAFVANRLTEVESLITAQSGQLKIHDALDREKFPEAAEVLQRDLTENTATLGEKLALAESEVASLSSEIAETAAALTRTVQEDIGETQLAALADLGRGDARAAGDSVDRSVPAFQRAEETFDQLIRLIIAKLDDAPPPTNPGENPDLDSLLSMLEDERQAAEGLGIPNRPLNISVLQDWMMPGSGGGQGQGPGQGQQGLAQARAAEAQSKAAQGESQRLEQANRRGTGQAQTEPAAADASQTPPGGPGTDQDWNRLASRLGKDLLQGRDNVPPEQYREAIENYFRVISDASAAPGRR